MNNLTIGREPIQIVEIVAPRCVNTYGQSPCNATGGTGAECFNTRKTCQDSANYAATAELSFRFSKPTANRTMDTYEIDGDNSKSNPFPWLLSVKTSPTQINIGGTGDASTALGIRASVSATFQDAPDTDTFSDPYIATRGYIATDRGTFWSKWLARNPFYTKYIFRVYDGYQGQDLSEMQVREYLIDSITNPGSSGQVTVKAKDPLRLAGSDRTIFPPVEGMNIKNNITTLQQVGIVVLGTSAQVLRSLFDAGSDGYYATIGSELILFTGATETVPGVEYTLTGVFRAIGGTTAEDHDAGDSFARVGFWGSKPLDVILSDLLFSDVGANIDSSYYNAADWAEEVATYGIEFNTMSAFAIGQEPIDKLVSQLADQCSFSLWWDDREGKIKFRFVRPPSTIPVSINDTDNILAGSFSMLDDVERRISRVIINYNPIMETKTQSATDFKNSFVSVNLQYESENFYGEEKTRRLFSNWIKSGLQAARTSINLLSLLVVTPKIVTFQLDAKDRGIWAGDIVDISSWQYTDETGAQTVGRFFIISADESVSGEVISYKAISYNFVGRYGIIVINSAVDFTFASDEYKATGGWICNDSGLMSDLTEGYKIQ